MGETASSWVLWSDGSGGSANILGDADWGKLQLGSSDEARSQVYDFGNGVLRLLTLTENRYGTGQGTATLQLRGSATPFNQDDVTPTWENYTIPVQHDWRYIQVRGVK